MSGGRGTNRIDVGSVVAGRFRVHGLVGGGGMGFVYRALDLEFDRPCALKVLSGQMGRSAAFRARFEREAQLAQHTPHPHILPVFASGVDGTVYYIAMLLASDDLSSAIAAQPEGLEPRRAVAVCAQIAWALDSAHVAGIVHRDVKPANVLLVKDEDGHSDDHAYLGDFGIAIAEELASLTASNVSSPLSALYASPEQARGERALDGRSDQYSLACSLYDALCGEPPFPHDTLVGILQAHIAERPTPPSDRRASLPGGMDAVLGRALAKDPGERYQTCRDFLTAAREALAGARPTVIAAPAVGLAETNIDPPRKAGAGGRNEEESFTPPASADVDRSSESLQARPASHAGSSGADADGGAGGRSDRRRGSGSSRDLRVRRRRPAPNRRRIAAVAMMVGLALGGGALAWALSRSSPHHRLPPQPAPNLLLKALREANASSDAGGLIPPSRCKAVRAATVICQQPAASISGATFQTYSSLTTLYGAYTRAVEALAKGPFRANVGDCTRELASGEISWNHDYRHPRVYSVAQLRAGQLNPASQAAGRLYCTFDDQGQYHIVWTQNAGRMLGSLTGLPHADAWDWWHGVHHAIALVSMSMQMNGSM